MDIQRLMDELLEHGCILQSREELAKSIIAKYAPQASEEKAEALAEEPDASI